MRVLILDNEAVAALRDPHHAHHRHVLHLFEANRPANRRDADRLTLVPTAVRVEARWDRTDPESAAINRFAIRDVALDGPATDRAASAAATFGVSIADAHIGATIAAYEGGQIAVATSDPSDIASVAGTRKVTIVTL